MLFIHLDFPPKKKNFNALFCWKKQKTHVKNNRDIHHRWFFQLPPCRVVGVLLFLVQAVKDFDGVQELQVIRLKGGTRWARHGTWELGDRPLVGFCGGAQNTWKPQGFFG